VKQPPFGVHFCRAFSTAFSCGGLWGALADEAGGRTPSRIPETKIVFIIAIATGFASINDNNHESPSGSAGSLQWSGSVSHHHEKQIDRQYKYECVHRHDSTLLLSLFHSRCR